MHDVLQTLNCAVIRGACATWLRVWTQTRPVRRCRAPGDVCRGVKEVQAFRSLTLLAKRRTLSWANTHPMSKCVLPQNTLLQARQLV